MVALAERADDIELKLLTELYDVLAAVRPSLLEGAGPDGNAPAASAEMDPTLVQHWQHPSDPRGGEAAIDWRVEH